MNINFHFHTGVNAIRLVTFVLAGLWGQDLLAANVVQVGNCQSKTGQATTITAAVGLVSSGGLVLVCPGVYPEQVTINKPLTIQGIQDGNNDAAVIVPPSPGGLSPNTTRLSPLVGTGRRLAVQILVTATTGLVNISNLTVDGSSNGVTYTCGNEIILVGIYYRAAQGTINDVATRNQIIASTGCVFGDHGFGILAESGGTLASPVHRSVAIVGNSIRSFGTLGIAADDFGLTVTISDNTISSAEAGVFNGIQLAAATGSVLGNSISLGGNDFTAGILADASHAAVVSRNTVSHGGAGIVVLSDDVLNGDANNSKITSNNVFDSSGVIDLTNFNENAGILICSNNNLVLANQINGSTAAAVFVDTCFNVTFGSTGNTIENNDINEACAGVLLNTTGNIVNSNHFANTVQVQQNGGACPLTGALASAVQGGSSGNTRRRTPQ